MNKAILGLDLGGVVIDVWQSGNDKLFFSDKFLETPEVKDAFKSIRALREKFDEIKFVSHCTDENRAKFIGWMGYYNFYEATGTEPEDITFCLQRSDKAVICKELEITHFVDDRLEILSSLSSVKSRFLFQPRKEDLEEYAQFLSLVQSVDSWDGLMKVIQD